MLTKLILAIILLFIHITNYYVTYLMLLYDIVCQLHLFKIFLFFTIFLLTSNFLDDSSGHMGSGQTDQNNNSLINIIIEV